MAQFCLVRLEAPPAGCWSRSQQVALHSETPEMRAKRLAHPRIQMALLAGAMTWSIAVALVVLRGNLIPHIEPFELRVPLGGPILLSLIAFLLGMFRRYAALAVVTALLTVFV